MVKSLKYQQSQLSRKKKSKKRVGSYNTSYNSHTSALAWKYRCSYKLPLTDCQLIKMVTNLPFDFGPERTGFYESPQYFL